MNIYKNKHLVEVACTFNFKTDNTATKWDSSYFGLFFEKINQFGFTEKEERKGFQMQFSTSPEDLKRNNFSSFREIESTMIFKNPKENNAIILGKNSISFNNLGNYTNWDSFSNDFIKKFYNLYQDLNLDYKINDCQIVYLNRFNLSKEKKISEYFNLITKLENIGNENFCHIQRNFIVNGRVTLLVKLLCNEMNNDNQLHLECGAISLPLLNNEYTDFLDLANKTKEPIRGFFEQIITDKLKSDL